MKNNKKVLIALVVMLLVSSVGFGAAYGYGTITGSYAYPTITMSPAGQVLGASTMSASAFINKLIELGVISADKISFINLLISLGIIR
jgi:hypothetical protein